MVLANLSQRFLVAKEVIESLHNPHIIHSHRFLVGNKGRESAIHHSGSEVHNMLALPRHPSRRFLET